MTTVTFTDNGTFTVPAGVTQLNVSVIGGSGGDIKAGFGISTQYGGYGGNVECQLNVQSGVSLNITVGKRGDIAVENGADGAGGGGGGSSAITYIDQIYVIAGGGGGAAIGNTIFSGNGGNACNNNTSIGGNGYGYGGTGGGFGGGNGNGGNGGGTIYIGNNGYNGFGGNGGDGGDIYSIRKGGLGFVSSSTNGFGGNGYNQFERYGGGGGGGYGGGGGGGEDGSGQSGLAGGGAGGSYANPQFTSSVTFSPYTSRTDGVVIITYDPVIVPCLLSTSCILTLESYRPISEIKSGDTVISAFSGTPKKVLHCGYNVVDTKILEATNQPMVIPKNYFKEGIPNKDVHISGHHRIICPQNGNNYIAIQTFKLGNFKTLTNEEVLNVTGQDEVRYYHLEVEGGKDAVFCDGLPVETLDSGEWPCNNVEN